MFVFIPQVLRLIPMLTGQAWVLSFPDMRLRRDSRNCHFHAGENSEMSPLSSLCSASPPSPTPSIGLTSRFFAMRTMKQIPLGRGFQSKTLLDHGTTCLSLKKALQFFLLIHFRIAPPLGWALTPFFASPACCLASGRRGLMEHAWDTPWVQWHRNITDADTVRTCSWKSGRTTRQTTAPLPRTTWGRAATTSFQHIDPVVLSFRSVHCSRMGACPDRV